MGASESGVVNAGNMETVVQLPYPDETDKEDQKYHSSLSKQNSILSLTLEEIQFRSGKSFGSMNMDEFLASVWSAEDNQPLTSRTELNNNNSDSRQGSAPTGISVLKRQGSFSVPTPLCNKTVDEVWYEIHKDDNHHHHHHRQPLDAPNSSADNLKLPPRSQQTLGEMTLEDFLFKAGVMQEAQMQSPNAPTQKQTALSFSDTMTPYMSGFTNNGQSGNGFAAVAYQIRGQNSNNRHMGEMVSLKNRRIVDGPLEVVVERRQRRMIKNRESALRGHLVSMVELAKMIINHYPDEFRVIILMPASCSSPDTTTAATTSYISAAAASLPPQISFHHLPPTTANISSSASSTTLVTNTIAFELLQQSNPQLQEFVSTTSKTTSIKAFIIDFFRNAAFTVSTSFNIPTCYYFTSSRNSLLIFLH